MGDAQQQVTVVGLGYVGLPLAIALAHRFPTTGFDISRRRIAELRAGHDSTAEVDGAVLAATTLQFIDQATDCPPSRFYIVTVPTPTDQLNKPDLSILEAASRTVGALLPEAKAAGLTPIIIFESTVYPGVTEDICAPILEQASGLRSGEDFFVAYSPERINPGDREHTIDKITKIVSGQTPEVLEAVAELYGAITSGGVFRATSIRAAEAAKVIENAQRDINIAFMNEIAQIFRKMDISVWDVLEAARTKWNFLPFSPGLVGGHCIGVDPYYLSHRAETLGHDPRVILAGRGVNDAMAHWVADRINEACRGSTGSALVLGLTFKEDVPDLRNSKVADLVWRLAELGHKVVVHDPHADAAEAKHEYGIDLLSGELNGQYELVVLAVPHRAYLDLGADALRKMVSSEGMLADLKGAIRDHADWTL